MKGALESYRKALTYYEALKAANPRVGADSELYANLGKVHTMLASDAKIPPAERIGHWREARGWYQRSLDAWLDRRHRGMINKDNANKPEEVAREIAKCDAALRK